MTLPSLFYSVVRWRPVGMQAPKFNKAPKPIITDADLAVAVLPFALVDRFRVPVLGIPQRLVHIIFSTPVVVQFIISQIIKSAEGRRPRRRVDWDRLVDEVGLGGLGHAALGLAVLLFRARAAPAGCLYSIACLSRCTRALC